jgi:hypothetical protein
MGKEKSLFTELLFGAAVAGNILFILWILYNGINEGFRGTLIQKVAFITLTGLLATNTFLLVRGRRP